MKKNWQLVIAGDGGQGIISAGTLLAIAAATFEEKNATQRSYYGPEKMGSFTSTEVIISNEEILYPQVEKPDVLVVLSQIAFDKYKDSLAPKLILLYDNSLIIVETGTKLPLSSFRFPFTNTARELGVLRAANLVAVGALVGLTKMVRTASVKEAILQEFTNHIEVNLKAFRRGMEMVQSLRAE